MNVVIFMQAYYNLIKIQLWFITCPQRVESVLEINNSNSNKQEKKGANDLRCKSQHQGSG